MNPRNSPGRPPQRPQRAQNGLYGRLQGRRGESRGSVARPATGPSSPSTPVAIDRPKKADKLRQLPLKPILIGVAIVLVAGIIAAVLMLRGGEDGPVPAEVKKQLSFGVMYPSDNQILFVDQASFSYNSQAGVLGFSGKTPDGKLISFNEQATPESFVDIPQVYDKLITSLQPYGSFDSVHGKVSLTHPKELKGGQTAVMNGKGTLVFARPDKDLSSQEWRKLFNSLQLIQ